ncbi:DNA-binding LytR/AlgR family response regulator [Runella defluvii]|uniref:DNA-binding LytR/AlgR family response regulator n=1 Tax=Runella defluvii TaxID=370973 RepID=A0A7W5ZSE6_9BACT|nr:LytTR family DNA-binding domain-containing protein [Runella defluvii]MBB3842258.1 DNA-binding LytR/AlgR family response regulator [Runella defluvii]
MQIVSCLIVDDDTTFVQELSTQLEKLAFIKIVGSCKTYSETVMALKSTSINLIFLDINLESSEGLNGFDLLRQFPHLPPVVIVTNTPDYAVESYAIGIAKDFLVKPFDLRRLVLAINRAIDTDIESGQLIDAKNIFLKMGRKFQRFCIDEIDYFEGYGIYAKVITQDGITHVINDSLTELEAMLEEKKFMRVHKSYIINLNKLTGFDHNKLYLKNVSVPIGSSYKGRLDRLLRLFDNEVENSYS